MTELLQVKQIKQSSELQPRAQMHTDKIDEYTESMKRGDAFPALVVFNVDGVYYLVDGYHRFMAAQGAKIERVSVSVIEGTMRDAILYSAGVNSKHGIQRTKEDKERAVKILLRDKEWGQWNDTKIAETCHVSPEFVGKVKKSILPISARCTPDKVKVERGGKVFKMDTSKIGKSQKKPVSGLGPVPKDHPNHGVGCAQPGSLPAETDLPVQPPLKEQLKESEPHGSSSFHTASEELAAKKNGIAGEMFPATRPPCLDGKPCPDPNGKDWKKNEPNTRGMCCSLWNLPLKDLDGKGCHIEIQKQRRAAAQAASGPAVMQARPITNERPPVNVIPVQLTKAEAEKAITSIIRGYFTPKSREQWTQLKKVGGWDTDLEALEGLRDDAAERIP